jgi:hypothetical protein
MHACICPVEALLCFATAGFVDIHLTQASTRQCYIRYDDTMTAVDIGSVSNQDLLMLYMLTPCTLAGMCTLQHRCCTSHGITGETWQLIALCCFVPLLAGTLASLVQAPPPHYHADSCSTCMSTTLHAEYRHARNTGTGTTASLSCWRSSCHAQQHSSLRTGSSPK